MRCHLLLASALVITSGTLQQLPRDQPAARQTGSASISGIVTSDELQPRPLRRARVMLRGSDPLGSTVITNDDGTFAFEGLPAGRYALSATKDGYVMANYGAPWQGGQGQRIPLRDGERATISIHLPRGATIAGTFSDAFGQPAQGATVSAVMWRYIAATGERRLLPAGRSSGVTDDRGQYRIYGLPAGDYYVSATGAFRRPDRDLVMTLGSEVQRIAPVPVLYPGVVSIDEATRITLAAGEEKTGVDFAMLYASASSISGSVVSAPGPMTPLSVFLMQTSRIEGLEVRWANSRVDATGGFTFEGIAPGSYTLLTTHGTPVKAFALTEVAVDGQDVSNIQLTAQPLPTMSGRIVFEGDGHPTPLKASSQDLPMRFMFRGADGSVSPTVRIADDGRFSVTYFVPGTYVLTDPTRGIRAPISGWWIKSVALDGRELLDAPLELKQSANVIVTVADRASELSGVVKGAQGTPIPEQFAIAFSTNRDHWFHNSRRVAGALTDTSGTYTIKNLPAGDYLLATTAGLSSNEWFNPAVLDRLAQGAQPFTLRDLEIRKLDVGTDK